MNYFFLVLGLPRSGSTSFYDIVKKIYKLNNQNFDVFHVHDSVGNYKDNKLIYNYLDKNFKSNSKTKDLGLKKIINNFKVGNTYIGHSFPFILDNIIKRHKNKIKVIHLERNKKEWLESTINNYYSFPHSYGNYGKSSNNKQNLISAYHYNEVSKNDWNELPIRKKFTWFRKKFNELIANQEKNFADYIKIKTEDLTKLSTLKKITNFYDDKWINIKESLHLNASKYDFNKLKPKDRMIVQRVLRYFDPVLFSKEPLKGEEYFYDRILDGFINKNIYQHSTISKNQLIEYNNKLELRLKKINKILKDR